MFRYIVPDTCAIGAALFNEYYGANADPLLEAIRLNTIDAIAPELGLSEFLNICRKKLDIRYTNPVLQLIDVEAAISSFYSLPILWIQMGGLAANAWKLNRDSSIETGDAFFLELARQWNAELWTIDGAFCTAAGAVYSHVFDLRTLPFS